MMIYISCAKTMTARSRQQVPYTTCSLFRKRSSRKCHAHGTVQYRRADPLTAHKQ